MDATLTDAALTLGGVGAWTVTALGTVAGASVLEAASHIGGALTVTTASTNAVTVTETTGGTGAVTVNHAGTQTLTLVTIAGHSSSTVNSTAANATTVSGAGALTYTVSGTAAIHTVTSTTTAAAGDTVTGGTLADIINLGVGPDSYTTGGAADVISVVNSLDTGLASGVAVGAVPVQSQGINTAGMDIITGMSAGVTILISGATASTSANAAAYVVVRNAGTIGANTTNDIAMLTGTYSSTTDVFTVDSAGTSTLLAYDDNGIVSAGGQRGIVLVGYVDTGGTDTWIGSGTVGSIFLSV